MPTGNNPNQSVRRAKAMIFMRIVESADDLHDFEMAAVTFCRRIGVAR